VITIAPHQLCRAIGRAIVDEYHFPGALAKRRDRGNDLLDERGKAFHLVVGGDHDR